MTKAPRPHRRFLKILRGLIEGETERAKYSSTEEWHAAEFAAEQAQLRADLFRTHPDHGGSKSAARKAIKRWKSRRRTYK